MREMTTTQLFFLEPLLERSVGAPRGAALFATDDVIHSSPFNILIRHHFPEHIRGVKKLNTRLCMSLCCVVHHLACGTQPGGGEGVQN